MARNLFEAAACGTAILSDWWEGLDRFFLPGKEIFVAWRTEEAIAAIEQSGDELLAPGQAARRRVLAEHTADVRAEELESLLNQALAGSGRLARSIARPRTQPQRVPLVRR